TIVASDNSGYTVDRIIPEDITYPSYTIINRNGVLRIKKPATPSIVDYSLVEIFTPALNDATLSYSPYYEFGHKYPIANWGTESRWHAAHYQTQTSSAPAIVRVDNGMSY